MAFTAVGALIAGAEVTAAVVLAAVTEIGVAMTVVGAVTGSKDLMKIGGVMSLVGGVGGFIAGAAGGTAGAAGLSEAGTSAAFDVAGTEALAGSTFSSPAAELAANAADQAALGGIEGASEGIVSSGIQAPAAASAAPGAEMPAAQSAAAPTQAAPTVNDVAGVQGPGAPQGAQMPVGPGEVSNPYSNPTDMRLAAGTQTAPQNATSFFDGFGAWANKNSTLLSSGMQLGGGLLKGAAEGDMWDKKMGLEQQKVNQTSFGNQTGRYQTGIVGGARA